MNKLKSSKLIVSLSILILLILGWNFNTLAETYDPDILETSDALCNAEGVDFHKKLKPR